MRTNLKQSEIPKKKSKPRSSAVVVTEVHPMVWEAATELCEGDKSRIEIIDETTVVVHNPGWRHA